MKPQDLFSIFGAPDLSRLTKKQVTVRLPIVINAQISALCEMYPNRTRTDIINHLLAAALNDFKDSLPSRKGELFQEYPGYYDEPDIDEFGEPMAREHLFYNSGPKGEFVSKANKYIRKIESEQGNETPQLMPYPYLDENGKEV